MNPLQAILDFFSNVRVGITFMVLLFLYSAVGSAGIPIHWALWEPATWEPVREWRGLELTEFEWFHWWPFYVLIGLFSVTLMTTTIRRIPLNRINLGVWTIHTGIITLVVGCVIYFGTKIEGDMPIARARIVINAPGHEEARILAMPGNTVTVGEGEDEWSFRVNSIDPQWELLSGDDKGKRAYSVSLSVQSPKQRFIRQVILGYPQYTEDLVESENPQQPFARAIKVVGTPIVDEELSIELVPDPRDVFHVMGTSAIYLREVKELVDGTTVPLTPWIERPVHGMPRFNDYVTRLSSIWIPSGATDLQPDPLDLSVPAVMPDDPLPGQPIIITDYLRAAVLETRSEAGGDTLSPALSISFNTDSGRQQRYELFALDQASSTADPALLQFEWVDEEDGMDALLEAQPPRLLIKVPGPEPREMIVPIEELAELDPELPMEPIAGTPYSWRVVRYDENLPIEGRPISLARVEIEKDGDRWMRWVFADPSFNGDLHLPSEDEGATDHIQDRRELDTGIQMQFLTSRASPTPVLFIAGPEEDQLRLATSLTPGEAPVVQEVRAGEELELVPGIKVSILKYSPRTTTSTRPATIPRSQRDPSIGNQFSMVRIRMPGGRQAWLAYHHWPFETSQEVLRRFPWRPTLMKLDDGRTYQLMLSRESMQLPSVASLDGFTVRNHIGGFTGSTSSVLNWTSHVRFEHPGGVELKDVSVNAPAEQDGYWYFQSQWDPPDPARFMGDAPSRGLNYTVLGVGNRRGVWVQLAGSILMVIGMLYAFYIKPVLIRRRQESALATAKAAGGVE